MLIDGINQGITIPLADSDSDSDTDTDSIDISIDSLGIVNQPESCEVEFLSQFYWWVVFSIV